MMGIPEAQLDTWSNIGAKKTSKDTYATVKNCLDAGSYGDQPFCSFLQGSYGNDTNIWKESDVDVVMEVLGNYYYDLSTLSVESKQRWEANHAAATYQFSQFKTDVLATLKGKFGNDVAPGTKAITIEANGNRRKADVLPCFKHKKITSYGPAGKTSVEGIAFFKSDGTRVVNYPRLHSDNLTTKNQATSEWYTHVIRIFKNGRQKLIDDGVIAIGVAPSYYIEGLLYNVPTSNFGTSYNASVFNCLKYLSEADRSHFRCANDQYPLLDGNADVTWSSANCTAFVNGFIEMWNQW